MRQSKHKIPSPCMNACSAMLPVHLCRTPGRGGAGGGGLGPAAAAAPATCPVIGTGQHGTPHTLDTLAVGFNKQEIKIHHTKTIASNRHCRFQGAQQSKATQCPATFSEAFLHDGAAGLAPYLAKVELAAAALALLLLLPLDLHTGNQRQCQATIQPIQLWKPACTSAPFATQLGAQ